MVLQSLSGIDPVFAAYVLVFGAAAVACFASVPAARRVEDPDTRRGLVALLITSGGWATAHVAFFLAPTRGVAVAAYVAGLVVGFAAVGPWLYFCSAYTGRSLHRNATVQRAAVGLFLVVVLVKLANPLHGLYFAIEFATEPFPHYAVHNRLFHWLAMGLAYALATVGYFMLLELFAQIDYDARPLVVLAVLTGLPLVLDVIGTVSPLLVDITYEPLGVAAFAVGVVYVYLDRFQAIQLAGGREEPVVVVSSDGRLLDFNSSAARLFPDLTRESVRGESLDTVLPGVADALDRRSSILELERDGGTRYYRVTESEFATGRSGLGRLVTVSDVTHREQYRRELERQNERLEQFASMVSHDLRSPLNVAKGRVDLAREEHASENLEQAAEALDRMENLIEDVLALARQGQPIDERESVSLAKLAEQSWAMVETDEAELVVEGDLTLLADPDRLRQLVENLFRNAIDHGAPDVTVRVGPLDGDGFYVADDGPGIPPEEREQVFESGYSTAAEGTGFGLAIVAEIAEAHGWEVAVTGSEDGGARFEVTGTAE